MKTGLVVWITGLPASGKSTLAQELANQLRSRRIDCEILESDELRQILTPNATYSQDERDTFYNALVFLATLLVKRNVVAIIDATAHRRAYRQTARDSFFRFVEVYVDTPFEVCRRRDPKGIYGAAEQGLATTVPGAQVDYEAPENPEFVVHGEQGDPAEAARRIVRACVEQGLIKS